MDRMIPTTMASQHPDHAGIPWWESSAFIGTRQEVKECFLAFSQLGISEYKWDWEGKFVDESVVEKLLGEHFEYFQAHPIGTEKFLTFRLPNPKVETEFRLGRAFMGILAASGLAKQVGLPHRPLFEVILPMTETASEILDIQEAYAELAGLKHQLYNVSDESLKHLEVIPLFEQVDTIMESDTILDDYLKAHKKKFGFTPPYMRPYLARSDPALNAGLVPTVLAIKIALSRYATLAKKLKIELYPILGTAALPFRGGLTPHTVHEFAQEYAGVRTALIQSAFRYDYPLKDVVRGISELDELLPKGDAVHVPSKDEAKLREIIKLFEVPYRATIEGIASTINEVASHLPKRRERVQHTGLFGYSRGVGKIHLPRAITFTGSLYTLGAPPEIIGTGRALSGLGASDRKLIEKYYLGLRRDLTRAGRYVNKEAISFLSQQSVFWEDVLADVKGIEEFLGEDIGPQTIEEREHAALSLFVVQNLDHIKSLSEQLVQAALLRKSLG